MPKKVKGFIDFIREQGVVGLAVGFILGGSISKVVSSLVTDIINPVLGVVLGSAGNVSSFAIKLGPSELMLGNFLMVLIDFLVVAGVVYFGVKGLGLEKLDKK
ncbi:MscL family protein [Patescibacteria group bacterium]